MAKKKNEIDVPLTGTIQLEFMSNGDLNTFIMRNNLDDSHRKNYYQKGMSLIIWAVSTVELMEMYHQVKDYIDVMIKPDHYKLKDIPAYVS